MKIAVTNLGPIKEATVELGGLTVFVGPNGTGKSYLAKVIYGLQRHETLAASYFNHAEHFYQALFGKAMGTVQEVLTDLQRLKPSSLQQAMPNLANLYAELFKDKLGEYFNDDSQLFYETTITYSDVIVLPEEVLEEVISAAIDQAKTWINAQSSATLLTREEVKPEQFIWALCWYLFWGVGGGVADYFPAARSNFMLTYKEIYRARADEHVGLETISDKLLLASRGHQTRKTGKLARFDRPTEDFISRLYDLDSSVVGPLADIAVELQRRLYREDRIVIEQSEGQLPDFRYQVNDIATKIRLHLTSSMVTETSALLIGFWHWIEPNSIVIIDEPESHLHPEAQKTLVNGLAEAINQGLRVILITHSPYILSCVNNLIKFGSLIKNFPDDSNVTKLKGEHPDMVALEKHVSAYHFGRDGMVKDIVLASGLIDEAEFTEPFDRINDLYEAMRDIEWEHRR
ncbi:AAA family ATPase [Methylomonas rivi]|uniref:AAA family ATPase n=1 Tax=Methylomonas rivi TaxID=2952226 RepID=A0ABT1TZT6_9GAMM|nr:AAA family ATPase [Methylomonas sp. WSC-6]MCQ8127067.1 AAA family ATPase [Methylomonas sp. WSC-6]